MLVSTNTPQANMDHEALVAELSELEGLSSRERLAYAASRRRDQLQRWNEFYKSFGNPSKPRIQCVRFEPSDILNDAVSRGDFEEVRRLLDGGTDVNIQNKDGITALHQAVIEENLPMMQLVLMRGADPNIADADLWTPLHTASAHGDLDAVRLLADHQASMLALNNDGHMPIDMVPIECGDVEEFLDAEMTDLGLTEEDLESARQALPIQMLADLTRGHEEGKDLDVMDETGATMLHVAAAHGFTDVAEFLLENGAIVDIADHDGWQPIHAAACWGHIEVIELLFNYGADMNSLNYNGDSSYALAADEEMKYFMLELEKNGRKEVKFKRSKSNSSRTLHVRRRSWRDKQQTSIDDMKHEGKTMQTGAGSTKNPQGIVSGGAVENGEVAAELQPRTVEPESIETHARVEVSPGNVGVTSSTTQACPEIPLLDISSPSLSSAVMGPESTEGPTPQGSSSFMGTVQEDNADAIKDSISSSQSACSAGTENKSCNSSAASSESSSDKKGNASKGKLKRRLSKFLLFLKSVGQ